jgi:hypothetical protein
VDIIDLQRQAQSFLHQVLADFRHHHPDLLLTGLNCECDAEDASLHIAVCDAFHDARQPVCDWPYTEIQQDIPVVETPLWIGSYQQVLALQFTGHDVEDNPQDVLCDIVLSIHQALQNMREQNLLRQFGFAENALIQVWTDDEEVMQRVCS